jgi:excisionase family DNA binding protein
MSETKAMNLPEPPEPKLLLNVKETAAQLNLSRSMVLALAYSGQLPSVTIGRRRLFPANRVRDWAASLPGAAPLTWGEITENTDLEIRQMLSKQP